MDTEDLGRRPAWLTAPDDLVLGTGEVHLWRHDIDTEPADACPTPESEGGLTSNAGPIISRNRYRMQASRLALRRILSLYLRRPASAIPIQQAAGGKPYVPDCRIEFSVSHSVAKWVCAIAHDTLVGVDVEVARAVPDCVTLARQHFAGVEADAIAALEGERRDMAFLICWTRKEAYLKLLGVGIQVDLGSFVTGVTGDELTVKSIRPEITSDVTLQRFSPDGATIGSLACGKPALRISQFTLPVEEARHVQSSSQ